MIKKGIPSVKFPTYEQIKQLDKNKEYEIILFVTGIENSDGRFIVNEDGKRNILFELIENGYCECNYYTMRRRITKKEYAQICVHAQICYNDLFKAMENGADCSWLWNFN